MTGMSIRISYSLTLTNTIQEVKLIYTPPKDKQLESIKNVTYFTSKTSRVNDDGNNLEKNAKNFDPQRRNIVVE